MQAFGIFIGVIVLAVIVQLSGTTLVERPTIPELLPAETNAAAATLAVADARPTQSYQTVTSNEEITSIPEPVAALPPAASTVSIQSTHNIESDRALLRGQVTVGDTSYEQMFFVYGYDDSELSRATRNKRSRSSIDLAAAGTSARTVTARDRVDSSRAVSVTVRNLAPDTQYYVRLCAETYTTLDCTRTSSFTTTPRTTSVSEVRTPRFSRLDEWVSSDSITFGSQVRMYDVIDGTAYLIYGESQSLVDEARGRYYRDIDEDDEDLQKTRVVNNLRGSWNLAETVDDLEDETNYYYVWCVEYDGQRDGVSCTSTTRVATHGPTYDRTPTIATPTVTTAGTILQVQGRVAMRPFNDGQVFVVYGTDGQRIESAPGERERTNIRQSGDGLQLRLLDSDLDGTDTFTLTVSDLLPETTYYTRLCVEYENENDNYREVPFVACSETVSVTTGTN